jgi:hypothetical protein
MRRIVTSSSRRVDRTHGVELIAAAAAALLLAVIHDDLDGGAITLWVDGLPV